MDELGIPHAPLESYYAPAPEPSTASDDGWAFQEVQAGGAPGGQPPDLLSPAAEGSNPSDWSFVELPAQAQPQAAAPQAAVALPSGAGEAQPAENATGQPHLGRAAPLPQLEPGRVCSASRQATEAAACWELPCCCSCAPPASAGMCALHLPSLHLLLQRCRPCSKTTAEPRPRCRGATVCHCSAAT